MADDTRALARAVKLRVGWRNLGNWEALPERVWDFTARRDLQIEDITVYLWLRWRWRPGYVGMAFPRRFLGQHLGINEGHIRGVEERLANVGLLSVEGQRGRTSAGMTYRLLSLYKRDEQGQLEPLDKHDLRRGGGGWDMVHHGFFLARGSTVDEAKQRVVPLFAPGRGPQLTAEAGGLFLYLLHLANTAVQIGPQGWVETTWRSINAALRINLSEHSAQVAELEHLGWLRKEAVRRKETFFVVSEAPAGLIEVIALAAARQQEEDQSQFVSKVLHRLATGDWKMGGVDTLLRELGWELVSAGYDFLKAELISLQSLGNPAYPHAQLQPRDDFEAQVLDMLNAFDLGHLASDLIDDYGWKRVRDVLWEARRRGQALRKPAGWALTMLRREAKVPDAPTLIHMAEYGPGGRWGFLFNHHGDESDDEAGEGAGEGASEGDDEVGEGAGAGAADDGDKDGG